jgi:hypothetical protein
MWKKRERDNTFVIVGCLRELRTTERGKENDTK